MFIKKFTKKKLKQWPYWLILFFVGWRLALLVVAWLGTKLVPAKIDYLGGGVDSYLAKPLIWTWANFDGVHYLAIARRGYLQFQQAFFPFYPFLIRSLAKVFKNYLSSGLLISHLSFFLALVLFYHLIRLDFKKTIAQRSIVYLLLFPTAFYFGSLYTESLFLLLVVASFYSARKKNWLLAGLCGGMASATRFVGLFLFPALLVEWWSQNKDNKKVKLSNLLPLFLIVLGLLFYMIYLQKSVSDPLYFIHVQPFFGAERSGGKLILIYQVFWRYLKMIFTTRADILYFAVWLELLTSLLFLGLTVYSYLYLPLSYFVFMLLAYLAPTLTGTFSSLPRYVLVLFPGFIALAQLAQKYRWLRIVYPVVGGILLILATIFFTRGYWIS